MKRQWALALALTLVIVQLLTVGLSLVARTCLFPILNSIFTDYGQAFPKTSIIYFLYIEPYTFILPLVSLMAFWAFLRKTDYERFLAPAFAAGAILCFALFIYVLIAYILPMFMISVWNFQKIMH